jgi:hypothetical protein
VECVKSESFEAQIKHHSNSCHSEDVEKPAILTIQDHVTIDQGFVVSQEERICKSDNNTDQEEEVLFNRDELKSAGSELYGCNVITSISR